MRRLIGNFKQGDTLDLPFVVCDLERHPVSVSNSSLILTIKHKDDDSETDDNAVLKKVQAGFEPDIASPQGKILLSLTHEESWIPPGEYKYELKLMRNIDGTLKVRTFEEGTINISESITKDLEA